MKKQLLIYDEERLVFLVARREKEGRWGIEKVAVERMEGSEEGRDWTAVLEGIGWKERGGITVIPAAANLYCKRMLIPEVGAEKADYVLQREISRKVPFEVADVEWDVVEMGSDGIEREVVFVALQGEGLGELCLGLEGMGFRVERVGVSPSLAYGAYAQSGRRLESTILVRVLGEESECVFVTKNGYQVRRLKFGLGEGDGIEGYGKRLGVELRRTIGRLRRENEDYGQGRIHIWGLDEVRTEALIEGLKGDLEMEMSDWPREGREAISGLVDELEGWEPLILGGLNWESGDAMQFDLLPKALKWEREGSRERSCYGVGMISWVLGGLILLSWGMWAYERTGRLAAELKSELEGPMRIESRMVEIKEAQSELKKWDKQLDRIEVSRDFWIGLIADLQMRLSGVEGVWIERFRMEADEEGGAQRFVYLSGCVLDQNHPLERVSREMRLKVDSLVEQFLKSEYIEEVGKKKFDTSERGILRFECTLELKKGWEI